MEATPQLIYRIARDRMLDLAPGLSARPANDIVVEPEHYLPHLSSPRLVVGTVPEDTSATIRLPLSQPGVRYQLYKKSGEPVGLPQDGNCEQLEFTTDLLPREWHEFYLEAIKINTDMPYAGERRLIVEVWINSGNDDGVDPIPMLQILQYGEGYELFIPDAPPKVRFTLTNRANVVPYPSQESSTEGGQISFPIPVMYENDSWRISTEHLLTGMTFGLIQVPMVYVYPNPNLPVLRRDQSVVPYLGEAEVLLMYTQASCTYVVKFLGNDNAPTHPPVYGNGDTLSVFSMPLADDTTLQIEATKVEGNLTLFLNTTLFIPVYPNPTLQFHLTHYFIDYAANTRLIFEEPQWGVYYAIEDQTGYQIGEQRIPGRFNRELEWEIGPFFEDDIIQVRAYRHGVNSLMNLHLPLFVGPNLQLPVRFAQDKFLPADGTVVYVDQTQASAEYRLYKIPGGSNTWATEPIYCSTVVGNGETIALPTGPLEDFRYQFYVEARKINSGMQGRLIQQLEVELKVRPEIEAQIFPTTIDYLGQVEALIIAPQPFTMYRLVDETGRELRKWIYDEQGAPFYNMTTFQLKEDLYIHVEGINIYTDHTALLDDHALIWVYPNPNLDLSLEQGVIDYGNEGELRIHNAQASVEYHIIASPLYPFAYYNPIAPVDYAARPAEDGEFLFAFGPLTYPVTGDLIAYKPSSGLSLNIHVPGLPLQIRTRPNHTIVPEIVDNDIPYDEYGVVVVTPTEPLTYYQIVDATGNPVGPRGFNERGDTVVLDCGPFQEDTDLYIWAFCELTQLISITTPYARLQVQPYLGFSVFLYEQPFDPDQGLVLAVDPTQASTDYTIYKICGDEYQWLPGRESGTTREGNNGRTLLHSGALPGLRYTFYVHAQKRDSGLFGRGFSTLTLYTGIRTSCEVSVDDDRVPYGYQLSIRIEHTQPEAIYEVYADPGVFLGSFTSMVEDGMLIETLAPIYEDTSLDIRVTNLYTQRTASLDMHPSVEVGPRFDLNPFVTPVVMPWQTLGHIHIPEAQYPVRYMAIIVGSNDPGWPNGTPFNAIYAQAWHIPNNGNAIDISNPMYDVDLRIRAVKDNGLEGWVNGVVSIKVAPNPTLRVRALTANVQIGQTGIISVENPQPAVFYQLRNIATGVLVGPRYYAGPQTNMTALMQQYGVTYVANSLNVLRLTTPVLQVTTTFEVVATKMINDSTVVMSGTATINVH